MVKTKDGTIQFLDESGIQRYKSGIILSQNMQNVYVIGGKDTILSDNLKACKRFDVNQLKWVDMPEMNVARFGPGVFESTGGKAIYAFGGQDGSIERLVLRGDE